MWSKHCGPEEVASAAPNEAREDGLGVVHEQVFTHEVGAYEEVSTFGPEEGFAGVEEARVEEVGVHGEVVPQVHQQCPQEEQQQLVTRVDSNMSQVDIFATQPPEASTPEPQLETSSSCPAKLSSPCKFLMFFEYDEELANPFQVFSVSNFGNAIKEEWVKSVLSLKSRQKKLTLEGKSMCLFGKMNSSKYYSKKNN